MEKTIKRAGIIGIGGIGSYFIATLDKLIQTKQLEEWEFECFDDDIVETKNILYQNFEAGDIDEFKTEALCYKYFNVHKYVNMRIGTEEISKYNLILLCVDNNIIRKQVWENWTKNKIPFIDARCNGRTIGIFSNNTVEYINTLTNTDESFSCQYPYQLIKKEIELGNIIIASILAQALLNYTRKYRLPPNFIHNF